MSSRRRTAAWCTLWGLAAALTCAGPVGVQGAVVSDCTHQTLAIALDQGGTVAFNSDCTIFLTNTITIQRDAVLDSAGHQVSVSGSNRFRIFDVAPGVNFRVNGLQLISGRSTSGAALNVSAKAVVTLSNCLLRANQAMGAAGADGRDGKDEFGIAGDGSNGHSGTSAYGGAVYNAGVLAAFGCRFQTNAAIGGDGGNGGDGGSGEVAGGDGGNGGNGASAYGGAIYSDGTLRLEDCSFEANSVSGGQAGDGGTEGAAPFPGLKGRGGAGGHAFGAAVYSVTNAKILGSSFLTNAATGGNSATGGTASNSYGTDGLDGGDAAGGGVWLSGVAGLTNNTFHANRLVGGVGGNGGPGHYYGGDGGNGGDSSGAAIFNSGTLHLVNATIALNLATGGTNGVAGSGAYSGSDGRVGKSLGGGIRRSSGAVYLQNTILSGNTSGGNGSGTIVDSGYNLSSDSSIPLTGTSRSSLDPGLGSLGANGGATWTFALTTNSPALDRVPTSLSPAIDQRHVPRPVNKLADIGALEQAYYLEGTVTLGTGGLAGVGISVGSSQVTTDTQGKFLLASGGGALTLTPSLVGYVFTPASRAVTVSGNSSNLNFTATQLFSLAGRVAEYTNGLTGVSLRIVSPVTTNEVVSTSGSYAVSNLSSNLYSVVPSLEGYRFDPPSRIIKLIANTNTIDFAAIPVIDAGIGNDGLFELGFTGQPGVAYLVEASTNLTHWTVISTNVTPFQFVDPQTPDFQARFYRLWRQ